MVANTLNEDEFAEPPIVHNYEPHFIVYGRGGWSDQFDNATINLLLKIGAIEFDRTHSGIGWEVKIYVSTQGRIPR